MALGKFLKKASKVALPAAAAYFGGPLLGGAGITNPALQGALLGGFTSLASGQKPRDALIGAGLGAAVGGLRPGFEQQTAKLAMGPESRGFGKGIIKAAVPEAKTASGELLNALGLSGTKENPSKIFEFLNNRLGQGLGSGILMELLVEDEEEQKSEFDRRPFGTGGPGGQISGIMQAAEGGNVQYFPRRTGGIGPGEGSGTKDDVPALLMDGEFVMTRDAVKGAGDGNLKQGINKMYQMMNNFERMA